jgi:DNA invertase Pin-like site-specific DNA recombinase
MIYGYVRVSTNKQETATQRFEIEKFATKNNIVIDEWVEEIISSRIQLEKRLLYTLLNKMQKGDLMITSELSRLGIWNDNKRNCKEKKYINISFQRSSDRSWYLDKTCGNKA